MFCDLELQSCRLSRKGMGGCAPGSIKYNIFKFIRLTVPIIFTFAA